MKRTNLKIAIMALVSLIVLVASIYGVNASQGFLFALSVVGIVDGFALIVVTIIYSIAKRKNEKPLANKLDV